MSRPTSTSSTQGPPEDEPSALEAHETQDGEDEEDDAPSSEPTDTPGSRAVCIMPGQVPHDLSADVFFEKCIKAGLDRMPVASRNLLARSERVKPPMT